MIVFVVICWNCCDAKWYE